MSKLMFLLKKKMEEGLKETTTGRVTVKIDEKRDEMLVRIKANGVDEFVMIFDHLSELLLRGKSIQSFLAVVKFSYAQEILRQLRKNGF